MISRENFMCEYKKKFHANLPVGRQEKKEQRHKEKNPLCLCSLAPLRETKII